MKIVPPAAIPEVETDEEITAALAELTGSDLVKCKVSVDPESGLDVHRPGYRRHQSGLIGPGGKPGGMFTFLNEKGQENQVPAHRVAEHMGFESPDSSGLPEPETEVEVEKRTRSRRPRPALGDVQ
jgi:hypothetical protein